MPIPKSTQHEDREELGSGLAFPVRLDSAGRFAMSTGTQKIAESVGIIVRTAVGERVMRSGFGSDVETLLLDPLTHGTVGRMRDTITSALARWEPRIDVLDVTVARDPDIETKLIASVAYRVRSNNALLNQVYPFYIREGAEEY